MCGPADTHSVVSTLFNGIDSPGFSHALLRFFTTKEARELRPVCTELLHTITENVWDDAETVVRNDEVAAWRSSFPHAVAFRGSGRLNDAGLAALAGASTIDLSADSTDLSAVTSAGWAQLVGVKSLHLGNNGPVLDAFDAFNVDSVVSLRLSNELNPLFAALHEGDQILVRSLASQHKWMVLASEVNGFTPLIDAALQGDLGFVKCLLRAGAAANAANDMGFSPLINASDRGHAAIVQELIAAGSALNHAAKNGVTSLHRATINEFLDVVKQLLAAGASPNAASFTGVSPLINACVTGRADIVQELLTAGATVNQADNSGFTPLSIAAINGRVEVVKQLLAAGALVNLACRIGSTPLSSACYRGDVEMARELLRYGATDRAMLTNHSPLINACYAKSEPLAHCILDTFGSASAAQKTFEGTSALHFACANSLTSVALRLIAILNNVDDISAASHERDELRADLSDFTFPESFPLGSTPLSLCGGRENMAAVVDALKARGAQKKRCLSFP